MDLSCSLPVVMAQRAVQGCGVPSYHSMLTYLGDIEAFSEATAEGASEDEAGDDVDALFRRRGAGRGGGGVYQRLASEATALLTSPGQVQGVGRLFGAWGRGQQLEHTKQGL